MRKYNYSKIDAFVDENSLGNPAACFYLNENEILSDNDMLQIAKEQAKYVSEVVFCTIAEEKFYLAYFSSQCEVNFCGHGTIACMHNYIKNNDKLLKEKEIKIQTRKKGKLTIYNEILENDVVYIEAPTPIYYQNSFSKEEVANVLGASMDDISNDYLMEIIDAGNKTLIVPIVNLEKEISLFPNEQKLKEFVLKNNIDIILIYSLETQKKHFAHTRVFAAKYGYLEDPATGSGNSAFGYYLLKNNMWDRADITLEQGGNDRIYNTVYLKMKDNKLLFGGNSKLRIEGKYSI